MSVIGSSNKSIIKKLTQDDIFPNVLSRTVKFAHKCIEHEASINFLSLNIPPEMQSKGFAQPTTAEIAYLRTHRQNLKVVSSYKGELLDYKDYVVGNYGLEFIDPIIGEPGEVFEFILVLPNNSDIASLQSELAYQYDFGAPFSIMTVGTSFPTSPAESALFYNSTSKSLFKYVKGSWVEIDWQTIVKSSEDWVNGYLRIQGGQLQIRDNQTTPAWYDCIPAVGANTVLLATYDNTNFTQKYWIMPGQTVIIKNANHVPLVYPVGVEPFFEGRWWHSYPYEYWVGLRPSGIAISDGDGQIVGGVGTGVVAGRSTSLSVVPIFEQANMTENWCNFILRIRSNQRWLVNAAGENYSGYAVGLANCSGTAPSNSYWLGRWYDQAGTAFSVNVLTITRTA